MRKVQLKMFVSLGKSGVEQTFGCDMSQKPCAPLQGPGGDIVHDIVAGMHPEAVAVQGHSRYAVPGKGIGVAAPDGISCDHSDACFVGHIFDHGADGGIAGDADDSSSHQLSGQVHIHIEAVVFQLLFMDLRIVPAA